MQITDGCFVSSHALLGEAVVRRMSISVYRAMHAAAAEVLQKECNPAQAGSLPWDCAEHWRLADNHTQAIAVLRDCANRALEIQRPSDAVATLMRALELNVPDITRLSIVEDALMAIQYGVNWSNATKLFAELGVLRDRLGRPQHGHDNFDITEYAGVFHNGGDPRVNIEHLRNCVKSAESNGLHKLSAARQLLMIAELTVDYSLAEFAHETIRDIAPGTLAQTLTDLLYHTCFGEPRKASLLATELADRSLGTPAIFAYAFNAGYAQLRVGRSTDAERTLLQCFELVQQAFSTEST